MPEADSSTPEVSKPVAGFVHLHGHTEYSALDGACKVAKIPGRLDELNMEAMAITDHGNIQGWPAFEKSMRKGGKKPIFGIELYLTPDRFDKRRETPTYHLTLLAENNEGLTNLMRISTYAYIEGFTQIFGNARPRADYELLERHAKGIICLTGCMASPTMSSIFRGDLSGARKEVEKLISIFGVGSIYGEIQNVEIEEEMPVYSELAYKLGRQGEGVPEVFSFEQLHAWEQRLALATPAQIHQDNELQKIGEMLERRTHLSQAEANHELVLISHDLGIKIVGTGDLHYLREEDSFNHDAMICLGTGQIPQRREPRKFSLLPKKYHIRSEEEMIEALGDYPEALESTIEIAKRCNASITYNKELLPRFPLPLEYQNPTNTLIEELTSFLRQGGIEEKQLRPANFGSAAYLKNLSIKGLLERLQLEHYEDIPQEYRERLEFELAVVHKMGYDDYFLIVWDLLNYAHENHIPAGPGRGSAAGSLASYALEITQLDPLKYDLLFERFLNPDRISMPDVDMDFSQEQLDRMREYARQKYNILADCETAVSQIVTFSTFKAKGALKDSARVLAEPSEIGRINALKLGERLSGLIPNKPPNITLGDVWKDGPQLKAAYHNDPSAGEAIRLAGWLEGMIKTYGQHAAAVIISDHPLEEDVPLQLSKDGLLTTQWEMHACEDIGLLKMDFLGLRNLDIIDHTLEKIRYVHGVDLGTLKELYTTLPLDDPKTYELYQKGETVGTFQFESSGMRSAIAEVGPTEFNDLIALVALYRPGPMQNIPVYAARKHGREKVSYPDPRAEEILKETQGICVYQEQSMLISRALAGFTPGEADELRKAIGKKLADKMAALKPKFIAGCLKNGINQKTAESLWDDNDRSAEYSFNKSHAACYAFVAYITAYLKAHYPNEYMASLLSSVMANKDKMQVYLSEAKRMKLSVLPPNLNRSLRDFSVQEQEENAGQYDVLFGLTAISGVGEKIVELLRQEVKRGGSFASIFDLIRRMPGEMTNKTLAALIRGGALDTIGPSRKVMFDAISGALEGARKQIKAKEKDFTDCVKKRLEASEGDQMSLFSAGARQPKLSREAKLVLEGCASETWKNKDVLEEADLVLAAEAALLKDDLRLARAEAKKSITADTVAAVSIAEEEGNVQDLKTLVEEAAQAAVLEFKEERKRQAKDLATLIGPHIANEMASRAESAGLQAALAASSDPTLDGEEWDEIERLNYEREVLGIYVTGHPLDRDAHKWARYVSKGLGNINDEDISRHKDDTRRVVGVITGLDKRRTKRGEPWYILTLGDLTGTRNITMFKSSFEGYEELLEKGQIIGMDIKVEEDTFVQTRQAEETELAAGENSEGLETEVAIKLMCRRLWAWQPDQIPESELRDEEDISSSEMALVDESIKEEEEVVSQVDPSELNLPVSEMELKAELSSLPLPETPHSPQTAQLPEVKSNKVPAAQGNASIEAQGEIELRSDTDEVKQVEDDLNSSQKTDTPEVVHIKIAPELATNETIASLKEIFARYPGTVPVKLLIDGRTYGGVTITPTLELQKEVQEILHP